MTPEFAKPPAARTFPNIRSFFEADPCTSRIKITAMLLRFRSFRFRNFANPFPQTQDSLSDDPRESWLSCAIRSNDSLGALIRY